jgi:hypothetical protein
LFCPLFGSLGRWVDQLSSVSVGLYSLSFLFLQFFFLLIKYLLIYTLSKKFIEMVCFILTMIRRLETCTGHFFHLCSLDTAQNEAFDLFFSIFYVLDLEHRQEIQKLPKWSAFILTVIRNRSTAGLQLTSSFRATVL